MLFNIGNASRLIHVASGRKSTSVCTIWCLLKTLLCLDLCAPILYSPFVGSLNNPLQEFVRVDQADVDETFNCVRNTAFVRPPSNQLRYLRRTAQYCLKAYAPYPALPKCGLMLQAPPAYEKTSTKGRHYELQIHVWSLTLREKCASAA